MSKISNPLERSSVSADATFGDKLTFTDGEYSGQLKDGYRHGLGRTVGPNESFTYIGEYVNNEKQGHGVFINNMKNRYSGRFKQGEMHEGGIVSQNNGLRFEVEYNQGTFIHSQQLGPKGGNIKLAALAELAMDKEQQVLKMLREGGKGPLPATAMPKAPPVKNRQVSEERFSTPNTIEMFGDDEEEPTARPSGGRANQTTSRKIEEVQYADPSELQILPKEIMDRGDYHWDDLQSGEAATFLTAYGKDGTFLVRTRPASRHEEALAVLIQGCVHHFKFEQHEDGLYSIGGIKKKSIPLVLAHFLKYSIYKRETLKVPLPPYIDLLKKLEALGYTTEQARKAFKSTRSYDTKVLQKYIKDNNI